LRTRLPQVQDRELQLHLAQKKAQCRICHWRWAAARNRPVTWLRTSSWDSVGGRRDSQNKFLDPGHIWTLIVFISNAFCQLDRLFRVPAYVVVVYAELSPDLVAPQYTRCRADAILFRPFLVCGPHWSCSILFARGKAAGKEVSGFSVYVIKLCVLKRFPLDTLSRGWCTPLTPDNRHTWFGRFLFRSRGMKIILELQSR
jgi:hypothetical protein